MSTKFDLMRPKKVQFQGKWISGIVLERVGLKLYKVRIDGIIAV